MHSIEKNLKRIEGEITEACQKAGRAREEIKLLCVVKKRPLERLWELHSLGPADFAENRIQEARERIPQLPATINWHFIGHLQTNKAKYLPGLVAWVHSVDRIDAARALEKAWSKHLDLPPLNVLLQFNISGEEQKYGAAEEEAFQFLRETNALRRLKIQGLMCMAPYREDEEEARPVFRELRTLRDKLQKESGIPLPHLSMGMTADFKVAISEGATIVRIGSGLFH